MKCHRATSRAFASSDLGRMHNGKSNVGPLNSYQTLIIRELERHLFYFYFNIELDFNIECPNTASAFKQSLTILIY